MAALPWRGILLLALCLSSSVARAQGVADVERSVREARVQPVEVTADTLEYEAKRNVYVARGNVVIRQGPRTLRADWIAFNPETGAGVASGDVSLTEGRDVLRAEFVEFDTETLEGVIREGELDAPGSRFRAAADEIEKTGEDTYRFRGGVFTTCRCPDEDDTVPWEIRAEEADVEVGGYGTVRDARFEVLGVPVLWFPWMIFPVKTQRETGFLLPEASVGSRDGFGLGLPFFWAVRENVGATLTPRWTMERGAKADAEVEYVFGAESYGEVFAGFAYDEKIDPDSFDEPYERERWGTTGVQDIRLPASLRFHSQFQLASDNDYPLDFDDLAGTRADRYLQSTAALARGFGDTRRFGGHVAAWLADDLQSPDDLDRDDTLLQRLPRVEAVALPGGVGPLPWIRPSFDAQYTLFQSLDRPDAGGAAFLDTGVDAVFDPQERGPGLDPHGDDAPGGTEGDGLFQEGEPLADEGHRVVLQPRVATPFRAGRLFEVYPEAAWHQTLWSTHREEYAARGLFTGRVDLRTRLRRRFGERFSHILEPRVGYAYVSPESQSGDPLLVPDTARPQRRLRSLELASITRDTADRIDRANLVTFGLSQRLYDSGTAAEVGPGLEADLTLLGAYDLEGSDFGLVVLDGRVVPWQLGRLRLSAGFDPEDVEIDEALFKWDWVHAAGHGVSLDYRFLRNVPNTFEDFDTGDRFDDIDVADRVNQVGAGFRVLVTRQWWLEYRIAWSFANDGLLGNEGLIEYRSRCDCWALGVEVAQDRARGVEARLVYRLIGLGRDVPEERPFGLLDSPGGV